MTLALLKSQVDALGFDFPAAVEAYRQAQLAHRFAPLGENDISGPAPAGKHYFVEAAVRRVPQGPDKPDDFVADYTITDDTPPPPTLDQCKHALLGSLMAQEVAAVNAICQPAKRRLMALQAASALAKPEASRSIAETMLIDAVTSNDQRIAAIQLHGATLAAEVEALPDMAALEAWKPSPFPA